MNGTVYCLSFPGGRKYVGSTTLPMKTRMHCHRQQSSVSETPVYQCWRREGEPEVRIIAVVPIDQLFERERLEVERLGPERLNVAPGGANGGFLGNQNAKGMKHSEETRQRMSKHRRGNRYRAGVPHSLEAKAQISKSVKEAWARKRLAQGGTDAN